MKNKFSIVLLSLLLPACSGDNQDLVAYINTVKHKKTQVLLPIPTFVPLAAFTFPDSTNRRNPFEPIQQKKQIDALAPNRNRPKQALEAFPLDALKFVGTLKEDKTMWALIKQPQGQVSYVQIGDYMGQNYGRILFIDNQSIVLEETTESSGKWAKHKTTMDLYTEKGEK